MHSAFLRRTGLLLMNNEIVQSILSTYTVIWTYLQALNSRAVVWLFTILCESLNVWLYYVTFVCCSMATGYFMSAAGVLVRHPGHPPPSVIIRHVQRPWAQARHSAGWLVCPVNSSSLLPRGDACPENLHHQPVGDLFLALSLTRQRRLSPSSTRASQP